MTSENKTYEPGQELDIDGHSVILTLRGTKWSWYCADLDQGSQISSLSAGEAVAHATKTLARAACRHGVRGWCPDCDARDL